MFASAVRFISAVTSAVTVFTFALTDPACADGGLRLATVAAENGYTYDWIPTEAGATLERPGVRVVIRAGRLFYEVNNATPIADRAPRFDGRDLLISRKLAFHLHEIALKYPTSETALPSAATSGAASPARADSTLTLHATFIAGRDAVTLHGTGPASSSVTLTLAGAMSSVLPIVTLSNKIVTTASDGSFSAEVEYGQDSHPSTALIATATTTSGISAQARVVIGVPSPQIKSSGLDDWPKK